MDASAWSQHDSKPDLAVVVPELVEPPLLFEHARRFPDLLREWWGRGYVMATLIDSLGTRTHCEPWQIRRSLGTQSFEPKLNEVFRWAIQAEILKVEVSLAWVQRYLHAQIEWLEKGGKGKMKLKPTSPPSAARKTSTTKPRNFMWL